MATSEQDMPFIRNLASSGKQPMSLKVYPELTRAPPDRRIRTKALASLQTYLTAQRKLDHLTALKLWKGLFFAMWMCDKPVPQQNLANDMADLYASLPGAKPTDASKPDSNDNVTIWFTAAYEVLAPQWTEIDVLRMEKFLRLVRRMFAAQLRWVGDKQWATERQDKTIALLKQWHFESEGDVGRVPPGLRLHALDIWVDEMERVGLFEGEGEEAEAKLAFAHRLRAELIEPLTSCPIKSVRTSARAELEDERLPWNEGKMDGDAAGAEAVGEEGGDDDDDDEWDGFRD
ncbi:nucleolar protein,Nop52 [Verticillium dahliae]